MDIVYLAVTFGFFGLSWALIRLCENLHSGSDETRAAGRTRG